MGLNTYPYSPFPASTEQLHKGDNEQIQAEIDQVKSGLTNYENQNNLNLEVPNRKNVLPFPYGNTTKTDNGITFTVNSDNTITVSGEATADAEFVLANDSTHTTFYLDDGDYVFSGCPAGGSTSKYYQGIYKSGQSIGYDGGNGVNLNGIVSTDAIGCNIVVKSGTNITDPITFSPMIRPKGTSATYTPYIPSVESRIGAVESIVDTIKYRTIVMSGTSGTLSSKLDELYNAFVNLTFEEKIHAFIYYSNTVMCVSDINNNRFSSTVKYVPSSGKMIWYHVTVSATGSTMHKSEMDTNGMSTTNISSTEDALKIQLCV